jgi:hypothetical protein
MYGSPYTYCGPPRSPGATPAAGRARHTAGPVPALMVTTDIAQHAEKARERAPAVLFFAIRVPAARSS